MFGFGVTEILIIIGIVLLLFGGPILTFLIGFAMGRKSGEASAEIGSAPQCAVPDGPESTREMSAEAAQEESPKDE